MKRTLLLFVCAILAITANAQNFDEADLVGTWTRTQAMAPVDQNLQSVDRLTLGQGLFTIIDADGDRDQDYSNGIFEGQFIGQTIDTNTPLNIYNTDRITNFAITNGNKLHIHIGDDFNLIFKIVRLTSTEMVLQPLGSSNNIYFAKSSFTRVTSAEATNSPAKKSVYNLSGQQKDETARGINIIKPNKGEAYKVVQK